MKIFVCDHCKYVFESEEDVSQCPDCGKYEVRAATQSEIEEYEKRKEDNDVWV